MKKPQILFIIIAIIAAIILCVKNLDKLDNIINDIQEEIKDTQNVGVTEHVIE